MAMALLQGSNIVCMTNTSVKIKFESLNEHGLLSLSTPGSSALNVLRGLTLLQDQLPAQLALHVPGHSIQRNMVSTSNSTHVLTHTPTT